MSSSPREQQPEDGAGSDGSQPIDGQATVVRGDQLSAIEKTLLLKRAELVRHQETQLDALHTPDKHHLADLDEMSSDTQDTDSLCAIVDMESQTLEQIDTALEKIDAGTFGACETCHQAIPVERLEVLPFAALCIDCQRQVEREETT